MKNNYDERDIVIGEMIRRYRTNKEIKQHQVNEHLGKGRTWCSDVERGKQSISYTDMIKLCEYLGIDIDEATNLVVGK